MKIDRRHRPFDRPVPPGDDEVPVPPPLADGPIPTRYCDLVLTGGVASGVVYPWAILELAREYRFRNIGGTSVGAMAAALAAAAEYGRCTGSRVHFEVLRRAPAELGKPAGKDSTRMLSLFQPNVDGRRLLELIARLGRGVKSTKRALSSRATGTQPASDTATQSSTAAKCLRSQSAPVHRPIGLIRGLWIVASIYKVPCWIGSLLLGLLVAAACAMVTRALTFQFGDPKLYLHALPSFALVIVTAFLGALSAALFSIWRDVRRGILENGYGLCRGGTIAGPGNHGPGLSEWLHDSVQRAAGLERDDPPLTFRDLWNAPDASGVRRRPGCTAADPPSERSINLQMITTNMTFGRPMRLPLDDRTSRLFFRRAELQHYFPAGVLDALVRASKPYAPEGAPGAEPNIAEKSAEELLELPMEDLPVVVAARFSLSFPILFSAVPLWAIDFEAPLGARTMRRCWLTDGGVSSNFPIHLFDSALPRWPTFGLWLDRRAPYHYSDKKRQVDPDVWLPEFVEQGRGDNWNRFDPDSRAIDPDPPPKDFQSFLRVRDEPRPKPGGNKAQFKMLAGLLAALAESGKDWHDRTGFRLPHVRNRVVRLMLRPGEGMLNIGMPRELILQMAHRYGTAAGKAFVERFRDRDGEPSRAWKEHRWIRFNLLISGLRERLDGLAASVRRSGDSLPIRTAIDRAVRNSIPGDPIQRLDRKGRIDPRRQIAPSTGVALHAALEELERLEELLRNTPIGFDSPPHPELRLRPPL